jgi:hypothetical protein
VIAVPYPNPANNADIDACGSNSTEFPFCASTADTYEWTSSSDGAFNETSPCITVSPNTTTTYTVEMTNAGACTTSSDVTITIGSTCYLDADNDSWGIEPGINFSECTCPEGYSPIPGDCDDSNAAINPLEQEICNDGIDNDCDGDTDEDCSSPITGCTDPLACNYDPIATQDDGSCNMPGCTYESACNYDPNSLCDDGSCLFPGCTDSTACNYDSDAGCDDSNCIYPGCTYDLACNYNSDAGCDDGSCVFMVSSVIIGPLEVQPNDTIEYLYNGELGDIYSWNVQNGNIIGDSTANSIQVYWEYPGVNFIELTVTNGELCEDTITLQVNTAITELNALSLLAYPNPTTSDFVLEITSEARGGLLEVYDAIGRVVHTETLTQLQTQIDSDRWAAGVYTLRLVKDNQGASLRVIKE